MADPNVDSTEADEADTLDAPSVKAWHSSHSAWLHGFLVRTLRVQPSEADDIVQDTWLRIIRTSLADIEHPRAFLSRIAVNLFRDHLRKEKVRTAHLRLVFARDRSSIDPVALAEQEGELELERLILDLPENIRDVFLLSRFRRMTNRDIATQLGISVKTVEWRIGRAIELCAGRLRD
ncbi:RNA polymerase sigma-70 factor, ECF subfamily [Sphingobium sp. YR657]|uniref:RNA polymerase sigma factor n=1 Tax=Sphingobium sp. YR657 TaxID=1884366 RepID=UPI0009225C2B|nr:RNA polymerase sigma factor [Sphingobium sp. YR657]SHL51642.1 RNA polymerase sigma-70 factor, ECF subfamily [Sphingobium sp. YR657]